MITTAAARMTAPMRPPRDRSRRRRASLPGRALDLDRERHAATAC
jgi:hypothetical protein